MRAILALMRRRYVIGASSPPPGYPPGSYEIAPGMWVAPGHTTAQQQAAALAAITSPGYAAATSAAGAKNVGAYATAPPSELHIPANTPILHPCLTREMILAQNPGMTSTAMLTFDHLGCMLDPVSGFRLFEDCKDHDPRVLCPVSSAPRDLDSGTADRVAQFVASVIPVLSSLGPGLSQILGPGLAELSGAIGFASTAELGAELRAFIAMARAYVEAIFGALHDAQNLGPVVETFQRLGSASKLLTDFIPNVLGDAGNTAMLVAHTGAHEALSVASNLLRGDEASIRTVEALAHDAPLGVYGYAGAKAAQDAAKSLGIVQSSVDAVKALRGDAKAETLDAFALAMPNLANMPNVSVLSIPADSAQLATSLATQWAGKANALVASLDPRKLAAMVPNSDRARELLGKVALGRAFNLAMAPAIARADQLIGAARDAAKPIVEGRAPPDLVQRLGPVRNGIDPLEVWARQQLADGQAKADRLVSESAESARALLGVGRGRVMPATHEY
jgi:hypothetical protein